MKNIDKALFIIQKTNDGDDLSPEHLKLTEMAVNGRLNDIGQKVFDELYENVKQGYKKPWFHGLEYLTIDNEGYVYWKGVHVEHYTNTVPVDYFNVIWKWDNFIETKLAEVTKGEDMQKLGFKCQGKLNEIKGYEEEYETLWVWNDPNNLQVVTLDEGNGYCSYIGKITNGQVIRN